MLNWFPYNLLNFIREENKAVQNVMHGEINGKKTADSVATFTTSAIWNTTSPIAIICCQDQRVLTASVGCFRIEFQQRISRFEQKLLSLGVTVASDTQAPSTFNLKPSSFQSLYYIITMTITVVIIILLFL
jgi:hypothetical protein